MLLNNISVTAICYQSVSCHDTTFISDIILKGIKIVRVVTGRYTTFRCHSYNSNKGRVVSATEEDYIEIEICCMKGRASLPRNISAW
jgi:hypothetical protein